ncbi:transglutaminase-like domain-containing protein [Lysobacter sp. A6]|uniref:Transglutaminase-like domain-containing protein n=1 Tax=Noviluteimonas lactosilytica TaxID=2888523 RepID=A0ABS8JE49_9GAMM|nr:transglutaminase-like domain-containing protein [Lysobacter lactosilyticus]MCC8361838.1 transglutaminase-like domain-containing protein [Lysobacter lactosilyticus]
MSAIGSCRHALQLAAFCLALLPTLAHADDLAPIRVHLEQREERIDYAAVKMTVDSLTDPATDHLSVNRQISHWERMVRANVSGDADEWNTFAALIKTLYEPGPWNDNKPFTYDLDDPMGANPANKRLSTYLETRKGNCVSMPMFVLILGQRLGLPVTLAKAPKHFLVKFGDARQNAWVNFEATAGGFKTDSSYERETGMTEIAVANQLYLRPLRPRENVVAIASTLAEDYYRRRDGDALMALADLVLAENPRNHKAMLWKGTAYAFQIDERIKKPYPNISDIPIHLVAEYQRLGRSNNEWFEKAEQLGWKEQTPEQEAQYLRAIEREKAKRAAR